jgi:hypothetical protein
VDNPQSVPLTEPITFKPGKLYQLTEMVCNVNGPLPNDIRDWPPQMQDRVYSELGKKSALESRAYEIVMSRAGYDVDTGFYVHVLARAEIKLS